MPNDNTVFAGNQYIAGRCETDEDLGRGGLRLLQPRDGFRFGMDSVLLAEFAAPYAAGAVADLGAGCGVIGLLIAAREPRAHVDLLEVDPYMADLARRNIERNALANRMRAHEMDLRVAAKALGYEKYRLVVSNPPYFHAASTQTDTSGRSGNGSSPDLSKRDIARTDALCSPIELAKAAFSLLTNGGRFCAVFPAARALALMQAMEEAQIRVKRIRCVQETAGHAPKLLLLDGVKNGGDGIAWMPPLLLRDEFGQPSAEWNRIYYGDMP